jgi:hypothetical protein
VQPLADAARHRSPIAARLGTLGAAAGGASWRLRGAVALLQLAIAVYGGYFGGGIGILMLGTLSLLGVRHVHVWRSISSFAADPAVPLARIS